MEIRIYTNIVDLKGIGEEWLVDSLGNVRACFIDGDLKCQVLYIDDKEKTKVA